MAQKRGTKIGFIPQETSEQFVLCVDPSGDKSRRRFEEIWKLNDRFQKRYLTNQLAVSLSLSRFHAARDRFRGVLLKTQSRRECKCETFRQVSP